MSTGWIVLGVIVIIVLFAFGAYNRLVALSQRVNQAFADIDVQLKPVSYTHLTLPTNREV